MSFGYLFFLPTELGGTYLGDHEVLRRVADLQGALGDPSGPTPEPLTTVAEWINRHSDQGADDPDNPPEDRFLRLVDGVAEPEGHRLYVASPYPAVEQTTPLLQYAAMESGLCLVDDAGSVLVNATGGATACKMKDSRDTITLHVDRDSVRGVLNADVAAHGKDGGFPFVVIEPLSEAASPVDGVGFVQIGGLPDGWVVEYRSGSTMYSLDEPVESVEDAVRYVGEFLGGHGTVFLGHTWATMDIDVE